MMYDLVIYIPTYNRPKAIKKQTDIIAASILNSQNNLKVHVVVQDNGSLEAEDLDTTRIEFRSNGINIGGNANIANGFAVDHIRHSRYLWILSDNDFLTDDFLNILSSFLQRDDYDFIVFDGHVKDPVSVQVCKGNYQYIWHKGLISNCLYATSNLRKHGDIPYLYHNSSFPHLAMALEIINNKKSLNYLLIQKNCVFTNYDTFENPGDYSLSLVGMPLLLNLMHGRFAFLFALKWLATSNFSKNKNNTRFNFVKDSNAYLLRKKLNLLYWPALIVSKVYQLIRKIKKTWPSK
jgi:glycosyltransferase involved in cell wall biosynthesis